MHPSCVQHAASDQLGRRHRTHQENCVIRMPKPKTNAATSDAEALRRVRRDLEKEYRETFACPSTRTPWGTPWSTVFKEALEADNAYAQAKGAIAGIVAALNQGRQILEKAGKLGSPHRDDAVVGLTYPEGLLYHYFVGDGGLDLLERLTRELEMIDTNSVSLMEGSGPLHEAGWATIGHLQSAATEAERRVVGAEYARGVNGAYSQANLSRRLVQHDVDPATGKRFDQPHFIAFLTGKPPRSRGTAAVVDGDEWRRAFLAEALDGFTFPDDKSPIGYRLIADRELAVISLLHGGLAKLSGLATGKALIRKGTGAVINRERKAIERARSHRGLATRMVNVFKRAAGATARRKPTSKRKTS